MPQKIIILFLFACSHAFAFNNIEALKKRLGDFSIGAHQGGIFGGPPNSIELFEKAYQDGANIIEMDLRITQDQVPVVFHDEDLSMMSECRGKVRNQKSYEVTKCFIRGSTSFIPSFEQALNWSRGKVIVNAEFKDMETIAPAIRLVQKYNAWNWVYFQTQNARDKYFEARKYSKSLALLFAVKHMDDLNWIINLKDPALLIIEVDEGTRNDNYMSVLKANGKLITEDVWHFRKDRELFGAACSPAKKAGIQVAITNRPKECRKQTSL